MISTPPSKIHRRNDYLLDQELVPFDCQASRLRSNVEQIGILSDSKPICSVELIKSSIHAKGKFKIRPEDEVPHGDRKFLIEKIGIAGEKSIRPQS